MLDQVSNRRFLVDTGASYSILPHRSSLPASGPKLFGPAGQPIPCWGERLLQLRFQDLDFEWKFLLADVAFPILGVDFLRAHKLLIDPVDNALLDSTGRRLAGQLVRSPPRRRWWLALCSHTDRRRRGPLLLQPTPPEQPAPEQPAPDQPLHPLLLQPTPPEQPAPERPAPERPAPEQPAPDQFLQEVGRQPRRRRT